ncbi:MAG: TonB-dependent receptor, partial [Alphaproteobacteria bacterium]|nr:TonB-dependent receptor [Alphaproteobacteria bacterium]
NATFYYEDKRFGARLSYSYRGPYFDSTSSTNGNIFDGYAGYHQLDASARYSLTKMIDLTLDINNLTDSWVYHYTDYLAQRNYENYHTGRNIAFGASLKF